MLSSTRWVKSLGKRATKRALGDFRGEVYCLPVDDGDGSSLNIEATFVRRAELGSTYTCYRCSRSSARGTLCVHPFVNEGALFVCAACARD